MPSFNAKEALLSGFQNEPAPRWNDTNLSPIHRKRYHHGAVAVHGKILIVGGHEEEEQSSSTLRSVEVYQQEKWNKKWPKLNHPRAEHATVVCRDRVYVLGGCNAEGTCLDSIECLNLATKSPQWIVSSVTLSSPKRGCTAVAAGSYLYVMGGKTDVVGSCLERVDVIDTVGRKLHKGPSLLARRFGCASAIVRNTIYVVGGQDCAGKSLDTIESLHVGGGKASWQSCPFTLSTPRLYPAVTKVSQCLVVIGGKCDASKELACVEVVDTQRNVVWNMAPLRQARYACTAITLRNSRVVVIGGYSSITGVFSSMEVLNLVSLPIQTQIAVVERELEQVRRGSSLKSLLGGGSLKKSKSKSSSLKAFLQDLKERADSQDDDNYDSSSLDGDELPVYDNGRIYAKRQLKDSGQAQVYKGVMEGRDGSKQTVAIKVFKRKSDWDDCKQELMTLLKISGHPNVMEVWDFYEVPMPAFVMRFVAGGDLRDYLDKKGKLTGKSATRVLRGIAEGLLHLHSNGIVHRDLKSLNVLLEKKGKSITPVVIDLGLGKAVDPGSDITGEFQTVGYMGTASWMAPEMAAKAKWSTKTDMFALGVIMWEVLTGLMPYPGMGFTEVLTYVVREGGRPDYAGQMDKAKVSKAHQDLVRNLWHKDPSTRPSAEEFLVLIDK